MSTSSTPHPLAEFASALHRPAQSARTLGYRWPAEWEPLDAVYCTTPCDLNSWPNCLDEARQQFEGLVRALSTTTPVHNLADLNIPHDDCWLRDSGPIFLVHGKPSSDRPRLACHDFRFNAWGSKYAASQDDLIPQYIARLRNIPIWIHDFVLEGGSIDTNGRGCVLTTEQCLLNPNRNAHLSRAQIEETLCETLNVSQIIWLPGGIAGDDTDGHVDDLARFITPDTIVAARAPSKHPDHEMLERNWGMLNAARDSSGQRFHLVELPMPDPVILDLPKTSCHAGGPTHLPASYANFLFANGSLFVPVFGKRSDDRALHILESALPKYRIVPVRCEYLVAGCGSIHCLTQQQPR